MTVVISCSDGDRERSRMERMGRVIRRMEKMVPRMKRTGTLTGRKLQKRMGRIERMGRKMG